MYVQCGVEEDIVSKSVLRKVFEARSVLQTTPATRLVAISGARTKSRVVDVRSTDDLSKQKMTNDPRAVIAEKNASVRVGTRRIVWKRILIHRGGYA